MSKTGEGRRGAVSLSGLGKDVMSRRRKKRFSIPVLMYHDRDFMCWMYISITIVYTFIKTSCVIINISTNFNHTSWIRLHKRSIHLHTSSAIIQRYAILHVLSSGFHGSSPRIQTSSTMNTTSGTNNTTSGINNTTSGVNNTTSSITKMTSGTIITYYHH